MKKVVTFALAFVLLLTVAGCGNPVKVVYSMRRQRLADLVAEHIVVVLPRVTGPQPHGSLLGTMTL